MDQQLVTFDASKAAQTPRGRGRGSASRRGYQKQRSTNMRIKKSSITMDHLSEEIRKMLFVGTSADDSAQRLEQHQTLKAITLTITTRGIGMGICHLYYITTHYDDNIALPNIYAMYRVFLGITEAKLKALSTALTAVPANLDATYPYVASAERVHIAKTVTMAPEPIRSILNSIGPLKYEDKYYIPAVAAKAVDRNGVFIPRSENILLSNLRDTVEALANVQTPANRRQRFHQTNPLPGSRWVNDVLTNPDDIMPPNYSDDDYRRESLEIMPYLAKLQKKIPKLIQGVIDFKAPGDASLLVSNDMETLHTVDLEGNEPLAAYYRRCIPHGNVHEFRCLAKLTTPEIIKGQINLLGEIPERQQLRYPMYHMRDHNAAAYELSGDYLGVCQLMYAI